MIQKRFVLNDDLWVWRVDSNVTPAVHSLLKHLGNEIIEADLVEKVDFPDIFASIILGKDDRMPCRKRPRTYMLAHPALARVRRGKLAPPPKEIATHRKYVSTDRNLL